MANKRGDTYSALIILVIGVSIVLYILMLPPEDRADLLGENITVDGTVPDGYDGYTIVEVLLDQQPGIIQYLPKDTVDIDIPSVTIYTKRSGEVLAAFDSVYLRKSVFSEDKRNITFRLANLDMTENVMLSFAAKNHTGRLTISINGEVILNRELTTDSPPPIMLPRSLLQERNILTFEISGPGIEFWKANEYMLENVKITGDVTDISGQENKQYFTVSTMYKKLLLDAEMTFVADCARGETNPLEIYLNKKLIFSGVPECKQKTTLKIDDDKVIDGENNLWFRSIGGNYILYSTKMRLQLEEPVTPTYYFHIDRSRFLKIENGSADVNATFVFPNAVDYKQGIVYINDGTIEIETRKNEYTRTINPYIRDGTNSIQIKPSRDDLEVAQLVVVYGE